SGSPALRLKPNSLTRGAWSMHPSSPWRSAHWPGQPTPEFSNAIQRRQKMTDPDDWSRWLGNSAEITDEITQAPIRLMTAALDRDPESIAKSGLRPLWHWLYFLQGARQSGIGA